MADMADMAANSLTFVKAVFRMDVCLYRERCDCCNEDVRSQGCRSRSVESGQELVRRGCDERSIGTSGDQSRACADRQGQSEFYAVSGFGRSRSGDQCGQDSL